MTSKTSRVAIVTGASGGIGRAIAVRLAADGMAVAVHYSGNHERAESTVNDIVSQGGMAITVQGDVAEESDMAAAFDAVEQAFGGVDVLIHTAGIMPLSPIAQLDLEEFDRVHRTNVRGTVVVAKLAAQRMRTGGAIVNFSTSVTRLHIPGYGAYAASKGAVEALTMILARELTGRDITVNAVAPGPTATPLFFEGKSQEQISAISAANPMGRLGSPEDIAETVSFLAGPARWVNGQVVFVNGGMA